jgi:hypothetical protein
VDPLKELDLRACVEADFSNHGHLIVDPLTCGQRVICVRRSVADKPCSSRSRPQRFPHDQLPALEDANPGNISFGS